MTIREKMATGKIYTDMGEGLPEERMAGKSLMFEFNNTHPAEEDRKKELINKMFGEVGKNAWIEGPIHFSYGKNVFIGDNFYANFNLVLVDDYKITIGNNVMIAPNVTISVTGHPVHHELRPSGEQFSFPVKIGNGVWIGSNVVINPGVTIGDNSVIGAGSVVTKDIPADVVAVGVPCKVLREITDHDKEYYYKNLRVDNQ